MSDHGSTVSAVATEREPAEGFAPLRTSPFAQRLAPLYLRNDPSCPTFGMTVTPDHANNQGSGHGGFLAAFVDIATTRGAWLIVGGTSSVRTLSSNIDFVAPVAIGSWVEATVTVDRAGTRTVFASCRVISEGSLVARATVVLSTRPKAD